MPHSESLEKFCQSTVESIEVLYEKKLYGQLLIVLYSSVDSFGLLDADAGVAKTSGATFKSWANKYIMHDSRLGCSSDDLWGARCAILHTHTSISDLSKSGKVREIQYISGPIDDELVKVFISVAPDIGDGKSIGVIIEVLISAFLKGMKSFLDDFSAKEANSEAHASRVNRVLQQYVF